MLKFTVVIAVTFCLLLSPWWVRNIVTFGHWVTFTESAGSPLLQGALAFNQQPPDGFFAKYPQYDRNHLSWGSQPALIETGKRIIVYGFEHEPLQYIAWFFVAKPALLYIDPFYWKIIFGISYYAMIPLQILLLLLGLLGMVFRLGRKTEPAMPYTKCANLAVLLTFGYFTLVYVPFVTFGRYGYPCCFILIIYAAYAGERLWQSGKKGGNYKDSRNEKVV